MGGMLIDDPQLEEWTPPTLAARVLAQILTYPETHDQNHWEHLGDESDPFDHRPSCGTTRCVAGWVRYFATGGEPWPFQQVVTDEGEYLPRAEAREALGLSHEAAQWLFSVRRFDVEIHDALRIIMEGRMLSHAAIIGISVRTL